MDASNLGFLARQLLLTELGGEVEEIAGGCFFWDAALWAGIWQPDEIGDCEQFILAAQAVAVERGTKLEGVIVVTPPARESDPVVAALAEALYVYGLPQRHGIAEGGPDTVLAAVGTPRAPEPGGLEITAATMADCAELIERALAASEQLTAPWRRNGDWLEQCQLSLARLEGSMAGVAAVLSSELAGRIALLWVEEALRGRAIGQALLAHAAQRAHDAGKVLVNTWVYRAGRLRYYLAKHGFSEQLSVLSFLAD